MHMPEKTVKFKRSPEGLCHCEPSKKHEESLEQTASMRSSHLMDAVVENRKSHMMQQFKQAKAAQKLCATWEHPQSRVSRHCCK